MKLKLFFSVIVCVLLAPAANAAEVNLYSARKENLIAPLLEKFTKATNIKVNLVTGKADSLLKRIETEGANTPADLFITVDAGRLHRAKAARVLQAVDSKTLINAIPSNLRDPDNMWFGLSKRARPVYYVKNKVKPEELSSYEDLANPKWRGKICIRSSSNIYNQSLVASMIANTGLENTENWARGLVKNLAVPPKGGDRDQIKAAAVGVCDIAIANTYYFGKMIHGKDKAQKQAAQQVAIFWPNQNGRGAHVNVSGIGLIKNAKNKSNAIKLMEYLVSADAQKWYAEVNYEYPVREGVSWSETLQNWGEFKADEINLSKLGELNSAAVKLMDRVGWQ